MGRSGVTDELVTAAPHAAGPGQRQVKEVSVREGKRFSQSRREGQCQNSNPDLTINPAPLS